MDPKHYSGHNIILDFVAMLYIRFKDHFQTFKNFIQILDKIDVGDMIIKTKLIGDDFRSLVTNIAGQCNNRIEINSFRVELFLSVP